MKNTIDLQEFQQFDNLEFIARQVVEGFITGLHKSPFHGFSVEFAEHRLYNKGESTKHIDWKLYARTDKLFVKRYEEETNLRTSILIDTSSSMLFPYKEKNLKSKLSFSIVCAAALIYLLRKQRDAVGVTFFSEEIELKTQVKVSSVHAKMLYAELEKRLDPAFTGLNKKTNSARLLQLLAESIHTRSLVIIFSDMMDSQSNEELFSALRHLRYNKHEVVLFHVTDKKLETEFEFQNRPYKFVDLETGEEIKLNPNEFREDYKTAIKQFYSQVKLKCGQYNIDLVEVDVNRDFSEVLLPYLIKRSKLH